LDRKQSNSSSARQIHAITVLRHGPFGLKIDPLRCVAMWDLLATQSGTFGDAEMTQPQPVKDASHLYEVERRAQHAARPGFRISELQLSPTQKVPWHTHTNVSDTFYVLEGEMRLFLQDPKENVNLKPGEVYVVRAKRPHLVTNSGATSLTFLILQGVGEYDFVPLLSR
jgi:mannose-6-phosphate isomerase-like protein (cupin superfamily)